MNAQRSEQREGAIDLAPQGTRLRAGFRFVPGELLAGGPVELEFFVDNAGASPLRLAVSGDRMRHRPGQFAFAATFDGDSLVDPMAALPDAGGPMGIVEVSSASPWRQRLLLNQFVSLEDTLPRLQPGATGRLDLCCRRSFLLDATAASALPADASPALVVNLAIDLRRDDNALAALAAGLLDAIARGATPAREPSIERLLAMRSAARAQIDALTRHPDPSVAARALQAYQALNR
jgi:hypothetical protein